MGGGVVAEMFRVLVYRIIFSSGGGGGSSRNVPCTRLPYHIQWGGPSIPAHFGYILGPAAGHPPFIDDTHGS